MKKSIAIIILLISSFSYSQDMTMTKSEIFKDKKKSSYLSYALETDNGGLVTIREYYGGLIPKLKGYYIQHFDENLKLVNELDYEVDKNHIRNAFIKDGQLHLIEYEHLKKEDRITINVVSATITDFKFNKKELLSFSEDSVKKYFGIVLFPFFINNGINQMDGDHMGEVVLSNNNKFFVINFDFKDKEKETHKVFVYNDKFEKIFEKLIVKDIKDRLFTYNSIEVDNNNGTVYFLGKSFENGSRKSKKDGKSNYHFELNRIDADGEKTMNFKSPDKSIGSLTLLKSKDRISCVGFYGKKDEYRYNGVCLFDLDPKTLTLKNEKFNEFSEEFLFDKYGDRENKKKRKKKKGLKNIDYKGLYIMENGDIVINAEEFYITTYTTTNANGGMSTRTVYHYDDIMALRMDKQGNLKWARNINKRQTGTSNSSYTSIPVGESSHFFINCSDKITKLRDDRISFKQTSSKKSNLYVITIDEKGDFNYKKLVDDKDSKVFYKVNDGITNLNNETVILPGKKKKNTQILKIKI